MRQRTKQITYGALVGALVPGLLLGGLMLHNHSVYVKSKQVIEQRYLNEIKQMKEESQSTLVRGWVLVSEMPAGKVIQEDNLVQVELPKASVPDNYITSKEEITGKATKVNLAPHSLLTESLLYSEEPTTDDLRNREMSFIQLPVSLEKGDVIDIRVQFPTGEDYILLSKKKVLSLNSPTIGVTLDEHEILSLSSAIVDAYLHKASIYALTYVEPGLQEKAIPTYPANSQVMKLILRDPNIVQKAENALNQASRELLEKGLTSMSPQNSYDFASNQAMAAAAQTRQQSSNMGASPQDTVALDNANNVEQP
jgi:hypothetical protein